eukprot:g35462.t1
MLLAIRQSRSWTRIASVLEKSRMVLNIGSLIALLMTPSITLLMINSRLIGCMVIVEVILSVKVGTRLHKDCALVTLTDTAMDRCICSWQIGKDEVKVIMLRTPRTTLSRLYTIVPPPLLGLSCRYDRAYPGMVVVVVSGTLP